MMNAYQAYSLNMSRAEVPHVHQKIWKCSATTGPHSFHSTVLIYNTLTYSLRLHVNVGYSDHKIIVAVKS